MFFHREYVHMCFQLGVSMHLDAPSHVSSCVKCARAIAHICTAALLHSPCTVTQRWLMEQTDWDLKKGKKKRGKKCRICRLSTITLHDNHSTTDRKLGCVNLSVTYPQAICRKMPITQSFKVSNWGPSVWICYSDSGMKTICSAAACCLLFKGCVVLMGWMLTLWFSVLLLN